MTVSTTELWRLGAVEVAETIRSGQASCREVMSAPLRGRHRLADGAVAATIRSMRMAMAVNTLGLPAVAVPVGVADGLPQSVQIIGPRYREDLCLEAAAVVENGLGVCTPIDPRR